MIEFDWPSYLATFLETHGEAVITDQNVLLFADGWAVRMSSPIVEMPPPIDELKQLTRKRNYWELKLGVLRQSFQTKLAEVKQLITLQENCSIPLRTTKIVSDYDDKGVMKTARISMEVSIGDEVLQLQAIKYNITQAMEQMDQVVYEEPPEQSMDLSSLRETVAKLESANEQVV